MANENYIAAIKGLLQDLRNITIQSMATTGVQKSSDLAKSVQYVVTPDGIKMVVADYYPWVSEGHLVKRRAMIAKVPISVLIQWIKKKGLVPKAGMTTNQLAFAIQTSIFKKGIQGKVKTKGKKYADLVVNNVSDYTANELADVLAVQIADELVDMFQPIAA